MEGMDAIEVKGRDLYFNEDCIAKPIRTLFGRCKFIAVHISPYLAEPHYIA